MSRPLRADARANHDRLLEVAAAAFAREGTGASLKAIAAEAGVGIGTLYRRFPTREVLVDAVYHNEVARLCAAAPDLLAELPPVDALATWMERFVDFMATKRAMVGVLRADEDRLHTRELLRTAIATLLDGGAARPGVDPNDVLLALGGITLIAGEERERALATRLIGLLLHGVAGQ
ncbi:TetR family transcriptional regulator [Asanoa ferruginea]|uniref:TetR family transcriptional regulator n=1 Tax=Asanoa ferruginea TaxID=53367 RepID=A0A3D9ZPH7_9ACTN|nr:TetR/AcrR family transcriptional regulator [Asanoa ferruginea]REF99276.1 TetR family transcriptional regulator [Asanoa ferruginea]GIF45875.1 TetR family transcriptional regulator [Asanoa ferruginea]